MSSTSRRLWNINKCLMKINNITNYHLLLILPRAAADGEFWLCLWLPIDLSRSQHSKNRVKLTRISWILPLFQRFFWHRLCSSRWACILWITVIQLKKKITRQSHRDCEKWTRPWIQRRRGTGHPPTSIPLRNLSPTVKILGLSRSSEIPSIMMCR